MQRRDFGIGAAALAIAGAIPGSHRAHAEGRGDSLRVLSEAGPNTCDPIGIGANRNAIQLHWNTYDRLVRFGTRHLADGTLADDPAVIEGELAERFEVSADGCAITFHLRRDATFHDATPVTADDVAWSLARVLANPIGRAQLATGSLASPDQVTVLDAHTLRITTPQPDRLTLPNLALTFPVIMNAGLARAHATPADPWAAEWLRGNVAGGGPYRLDAYAPGQAVTLSRFEDWRSGARPGFRRVLWQVVPEPQSRVAALVRGDADLVQDLPPEAAASLAPGPSGARVLGLPAAGSFQFIGMDGSKPPFDAVKVRQAVAFALPYQAMFEAALLGRGRALFGGAEVAQGTAFPQPMGTRTDPDRARALLAEAGYPRGLDTTLTIDLALASVAEPVALLVQEALGRIGLRVAIRKLPAGQLGTLLQAKAVPFFFEATSAFLSEPDYVLRVFYSGATRWNFGSYANPEFDALVARTRLEADQAAYARDVGRMITLAKQELPIIPLWQPDLELGLLHSVTGYRSEFHHQLDLRTLRRV